MTRLKRSLQPLRSKGSTFLSPILKHFAKTENFQLRCPAKSHQLVRTFWFVQSRTDLACQRQWSQPQEQQCCNAAGLLEHARCQPKGDKAASREPSCSRYCACSRQHVSARHRHNGCHGRRLFSVPKP